jgi:hypothetical protein
MELGMVFATLLHSPQGEILIGNMEIARNVPRLRDLGKTTSK